MHNITKIIYINANVSKNLFFDTMLSNSFSGVENIYFIIFHSFHDILPQNDLNCTQEIRAEKNKKNMV
jgi:hypothetical protein